MNKQEIINKIAKSKGFHHAEYLCVWNGYEVYATQIDANEGNEPPNIGLPVYILVDKQGRIRVSRNDEWKKIIATID